MMLDSKYFVNFYNKNDDNMTFEGYYPKNHAMILYSLVDNSPLACLQIKYSNNNDNNILITELNESNNEEQFFEAVFKKDNEFIEIIITNLTSGIINFNLMKEDKKVDTVNPYGLNKLNEINKYTSYVIKSDQTNGERTFKVKSNTSNNKKTLLKQDVKNCSIGTYLYLSVVPKNDDNELCKKFKKTIWRPDDFFVIKKKLENNMTRYYTNSFPFFTLQSGGRSVNLVDDERTRGSEYFNLERNGTTYFNNDITKNINEHKNLSRNTNDFTYTYEKNENIEDFDEEIMEISNEYKNNYKKEEDNFESKHSDIYKSYVANLESGEKIKFKSYETDYEYNYDLHSKKCKLGFSVNTTLKIAERQNDDVYIEQMKKLLEQTVDLSYLLEEINKIYTEENCCICLDEKPNTILYKCGHNCVHEDCSKNITHCPICRAYIYAKIKSK